MRWATVCLLGLLPAGIQDADADTIRYRADLTVTRGAAGIAVGETGSMFVEHADNLISQPNNIPDVGWYGDPVGPTPVRMLWSFRDGSAVQSETGTISLGLLPGGGNAFYSIAAVTGRFGAPPISITKGLFAPHVHSGSNNLWLRDPSRTALDGPALVAPVLGDYSIESAELAFVGNSFFLSFDVTDIVPIPAADAAAEFTAGSPVSLTQAIATPATTFDVGFDYSFNSTAVASGATLQVSLGGVVLESFDTPPADVVQSTTISVTDAALGNQDALDLEFLFNGPTGSAMLLDNVVIPGSDLINGDFQTHSLAAWDVNGPGTVGVQAVPEPTTFAIVVLGLLSLGVVARQVGVVARQDRRRA